MTLWTPYQKEQLASRWGHMSGKEISQEIFGDPFHRSACIAKARRMGLEKFPNPVKSIAWDDKRFKALWNRGATVTHMAHVFECGNDAIRRHAADMKLPLREKVDRVRPKRKQLKKETITVKRVRTPDTSLPMQQYTGVPREKGWFRDSTDCTCGYKMPPGASHCYGEAHERS